VAVEKLAPDFTLTLFSGEKVRLADFRGNVVLLNFWAAR
jgi:peroxiredoxin